MEHCCEDLVAFSQSSISEIRCWCWMISSGWQMALQPIPKDWDGAPSFQRTQVYCLIVQCWGASYPSSQHLTLGMVTLGSCAAAPQLSILLVNATMKLLWRFLMLSSERFFFSIFVIYYFFKREEANEKERRARVRKKRAKERDRKENIVGEGLDRKHDKQPYMVMHPRSASVTLFFFGGTGLSVSGLLPRVIRVLQKTKSHGKHAWHKKKIN